MLDNSIDIASIKNILYNYERLASTVRRLRRTVTALVPEGGICLVCMRFFICIVALYALWTAQSFKRMIAGLMEEAYRWKRVSRRLTSAYQILPSLLLLLSPGLVFSFS
jgi:hypothetical protein